MSHDRVRTRIRGLVLAVRRAEHGCEGKGNPQPPAARPLAVPMEFVVRAADASAKRTSFGMSRRPWPDGAAQGRLHDQHAMPGQREAWRPGIHSATFARRSWQLRDALGRQGPSMSERFHSQGIAAACCFRDPASRFPFSCTRRRTAWTRNPFTPGSGRTSPGQPVTCSREFQRVLTTVRIRSRVRRTRSRGRSCRGCRAAGAGPSRIRRDPGRP